jgi:hypothetical protein
VGLRATVRSNELFVSVETYRPPFVGFLTTYEPDGPRQPTSSARPPGSGAPSAATFSAREREATRPAERVSRSAQVEPRTGRLSIRLEPVNLDPGKSSFLSSQHEVRPRGIETRRATTFSPRDRDATRRERCESRLEANESIRAAQRSSVPGKLASSPARGCATPGRLASSPARGCATRDKGAPSPTTRSATRGRLASSPARGSATRGKGASSPARGCATPGRLASSPPEEARHAAKVLLLRSQAARHATKALALEPDTVPIVASLPFRPTRRRSRG